MQKRENKDSEESRSTGQDSVRFISLVIFPQPKEYLMKIVVIKKLLIRIDLAKFLVT